jgi:hypothetical protein
VVECDDVIVQLVNMQGRCVAVKAFTTSIAPVVWLRLQTPSKTVNHLLSPLLSPTLESVLTLLGTCTPIVGQGSTHEGV